MTVLDVLSVVFLFVTGWFAGAERAKTRLYRLLLDEHRVVVEMTDRAQQAVRHQGHVCPIPGCWLCDGDYPETWDELAEGDER